jgi:hypothetical protein
MIEAELANNVLNAVVTRYRTTAFGNGECQPNSQGTVRIASDRVDVYTHVCWSFDPCYLGATIGTILDDVRGIHRATPCCSEIIPACIIRCQFSLSRCRGMLVDRILERARSSSIGMFNSKEEMLTSSDL